MQLGEEVWRKSSMCVFISGPTPTCGRRIGRFNVGFIDKFNLFWKRKHLFGPGGLHLNRAGSCVLSANLAYGVPHACITALSFHYPKPTHWSVRY